MMVEIFNPKAKVICPFRSTADKEVFCVENCALYAKNDNCAFVNLGSADLPTHLKELKDAIYNIELIVPGR